MFKFKFSALPVLGVIALIFIVLPFLGLILRLPWSELPQIAGSEVWLQSLWISLSSTFLTTTIALICGVPLAFLMSQSEKWSRLRPLVSLPLTLPPIVGGVLLLIAWGRRGSFGQWIFQWWGISIPFTWVAVVFAQLFVSIPIIITAAESSFRAIPHELLDTATVCGASDLMKFWSVALPVARPGITSAGFLGFTRALGEFGATITFAGALPGVTQTLPTAIYRAMESNPALALGMSFFLVIFTSLLLFLLRSRLKAL